MTETEALLAPAEGLGIPIREGIGLWCISWTIIELAQSLVREVFSAPCLSAQEGVAGVTAC